MATLLLSAGAGLLVAVFYTASPLTVWAVAATPCLFFYARRGLDDDERRALTTLLIAAIIPRVLLVLAMFVTAWPRLDELSIGALAGDESYNLSRALRARDILLGFGTTHHDYFVNTEDYGQTLYVSLLGWLQFLFGPTPYGMRLLNGLMFLTGTVLLYRLARRSFGPRAALLGLAVLLFIPSLLVSSVSLLKESLYFLITCVTLTVVMRAVRDLRPATIGGAMAAGIGSMWLLNELRRGAAMLILSGVVLGLLMRTVGITRRRLTVALTTVAVGSSVVWFTPSLHERLADGLRFTARTHAGNVFTVGHAYKLLDDGYYVMPSLGSEWALGDGELARFVVRGVAAFVVAPLPWEITTRSELAFLPEYLFWLGLVALIPAGLVAGWRRDPWLTSLLVGYAVPTAIAVALTNGNVGTLLRLRGLVSPYLVWLGALGLLALAQVWIASRRDLTITRQVWAPGTVE